MDLAGAPRLAPEKTREALSRFLNRPLSRKLIAEVQAAVVEAYRRAGYPFVSVSTPAQELTGGVLQVRVIEFRAGQIVIKGAQRTRPAYLASRIRLKPGDTIAADDLSEDLDTLNRYPFRHVDATFTPGAGLGQSDLILNVVETRPRSAFAGYANSGSPSTGWDRYFAGFEVGGLLGPDSLISDQATASSDAMFEKNRPFNGVSHPRYLSDAVSVTAPTGPRAQIEASFDWVASDAAADPFVLRQTTYEARLGYRFAISNLGETFRGFGEARFGLEAKHQETETLFGGARALDLSIEVYQAYLGYARSEVDAAGRSDIDLLLHISPGDLGADRKPQALLFSKGRVSDVRYAYLGLTANRSTRLPFGLTWTAQVIGQYAPRALQNTEQMGIGGQSLVRGYVLDDGSYDQALILRDELRAPPVNLSLGPIADQISSFVFVDAGWTRGQATDHPAPSGPAAPRGVRAASVGLGVDEQFAGRVTLGIDGAYALERATLTRAGDWRLETRASLAF
jgi:hemolysin activation/secretion protein